MPLGNPLRLFNVPHWTSSQLLQELERKNKKILEAIRFAREQRRKEKWETLDGSFDMTAECRLSISGRQHQVEAKADSGNEVKAKPVSDAEMEAELDTAIAAETAARIDADIDAVIQVHIGAEVRAFI
ncbi:hypothetical protein EDC01DRAFT_633303 [Geopyxis carbonaria]|nr:hypothetical protein EDC01DRAFT_633303 [Geopyxis carbonaria]